MNIIGDIIQGINGSFNLLNDEDPEDLQVNEELGQGLGMEDIMTVPLQQWYAPFAQIQDYSKDNSYNTLAYLNKLGYTHAVWEVCESHDTLDVCDSLHGRQFTINELLLNSQHNPPSPMFTLSHPQCFCFLKVFPPAGPEGIPDDAPGLPYNYQQVTPGGKQTLKFKKQLYRKMFEVYLDAFTLLPPQDDVLKYSSTTLIAMARYGGMTPPVHSYTCPVVLNTNLNCYLPLHLLRQVEAGMVGCQIKVCNNFSIVYMVDLNRLMIIPTPALTAFSFSNGEEVLSSSLIRGDFIVLENDILGIYQHGSNEGFNCYIPEWNTTNVLGHDTVIKLVK